MTRALWRFAAGLIFLGIGGATAFGAAIRITAPAAPGSGWDQLAQVLASELATLPEAGGASVVNVPGGSGTVGLAQFATAATDHELLVVGLTMMDSTIVTRSTVTIEQLTPVARLSLEPFALAVPEASPFRTVAELAAAFVADPGKMPLAGGPVGGVDHAAAIQLVRALGLTPAALGYVPFLSSAEAARALAEDRVPAALTALGELQGEIAGGRVRILGLATPERSPDAADVPTLSEGGVKLSFANWRGLVARAGLPRADRDRLSGLVQRAVSSPAWTAMLARKKWDGAYLPADAFQAFLRVEQLRLKDTLKSAGLLKRGDD